MSIGVFSRTGRRNVPTLVNRAYGKSFFWDGRATTLEEQVLQPIRDSLEMGLELDEAVSRLNADPTYAGRFRNVFGRAASATDLGAALASYVRTILSGDTPFDRYARGRGDTLSPEVRTGLQLFRGKAGCVSCHMGPNFTDELFHNTGVGWRDGAFTDSGRYLVTGRPQDVGAFKTPTLRELARTAPYMHNGSLQTLEDVIEFYDGGGRANPLLDPRIHGSRLTKMEKQALLAFLLTLGPR